MPPRVRRHDLTYPILCRNSIGTAIIVFSLGCGGSDPTTPPVTTKLAFTTQPTVAAAGAAITPTVQVTIQDLQGNTMTGANTRVAIEFAADVVNATLLGTKSVNAVGGVATFADLAVDVRGAGYRLNATAPGSERATSDPFSVSLAFDVVSAGVAHTCGIAAAHTYCWGVNEFGQLGDGSTTWELLLFPTLTSGGHAFAAVDAGRSHTCALKATGSAYCWGANGYGQLGDGTGSTRFSPTPVIGGITFATISVGDSHTCGLTPAGAAYCWGANSRGALGDGTTTTRLAPVAVAGGLSFKVISAGITHTCAITTALVAYCWGENYAGALGDGTETNSSTPAQVSGGASFVGISAGQWYTCAITGTGAAYCWGANFAGYLGDGTTFIRTTPTPVVGGIAFAWIGVSYGHTCGLTSSGVAYCWGENGSGQLGDGARSSPKLVPTPVSGGLSFRSLGIGQSFTCGVTTASEAYCWGLNETGVFGDGTQFINSSTPKRAGL